jgi:hypothetical protein
MKLPASLAACAALAIAPASLAQVAWDEAIDGDLSDNELAPTDLAQFSEGSNIVSGSSVPDPDLDRDFFTFEIPAGLELDRIVLLQYDTTQTQSFIALENEAFFSQLQDPFQWLGATLFGDPNLGNGVGDDILDDLGMPLFGGEGFSGNLGPGVYTIWYQETAAPVDYSFDFVLIPAPGAMLFGVAGLAALRRRR